ncbi:NYN domain-containing protein [Amylocystis lapponica]|nr:NYN domain-containing protein [Amylocystis lapponica]
MTAAPQKVGVFWDYENCALPTNASGSAAVNNIRELAHRFGSVTTFNAYSELQTSIKSNNLRSELQSCGVSLIDCPHDNRKDVADKMIIVDMLAYALDMPAPATIILISGDRDFAYAVSVLCLRRYNVVLLAPSNASPRLKSQATELFTWPGDVLPSLKTRRDSTSSTPSVDSDGVRPASRASPSRPKRASVSTSSSSSPASQTDGSSAESSGSPPVPFTLESWKASQPAQTAAPVPSPSPAAQREELVADCTTDDPVFTLNSWKAKQAASAQMFSRMSAGASSSPAASDSVSVSTAHKTLTHEPSPQEQGDSTAVDSESDDPDAREETKAASPPCPAAVPDLVSRTRPLAHPARLHKPPARAHSSAGNHARRCRPPSRP